MTTFFLPDALIHETIEDFTTEAERALAIYEATPTRQRTPDERAAITALKRDIAAYQNVAKYWDAGIYPRAIDGIWEVASLSERGTQHHIWRENNRWVCDCKAAGRGYFHVHQAMMCVLERALELAEQHGLEADGADVQAALGADAYECYEPAPTFDDEPWLCDYRLPTADDEPPTGDGTARAWPADAEVQRLASRLTAARAARYWQVAA